MKTTHTQTEWQQAEHNKSFIVNSQDPVEQTIICKVYGSDGEAEANARLIAAAPDLLEALDTAVQYIDAKRYPELMQMCEAAISKAKGE